MHRLSGRRPQKDRRKIYDNDSRKNPGSGATRKFNVGAGSGRDEAALEKLAKNGRLAAYVDEFKSIVANNRGHIVVKCAFQMISKSKEVATKLNGIARQLRGNMPDYRLEMTVEMKSKHDG